YAAIVEGRYPVKSAAERGGGEANHAASCELRAQCFQGLSDLFPSRRGTFHQARLATSATFEKTPWVHRDQTAEDPSQCEHAEDKPEHMMPVKPATIGRQFPFLAASKLNNPQNDPYYSKKGAKERGPDDRLAPDLLLDAQRLEIQEVRY